MYGHNKRYLLTHDCPQCGTKDAPYEWGGARMSSTAWGHDFTCCSEECGQAFAVTWREKITTKQGRKELRKLWEKLAGQAEHRLSGQPYPGYDAEQQLRSLGRY